MAKLHYIVRRSRLGRFNFTLLTSHGRLTGLVTVEVAGKTKEEVAQAAHDQIRALASEFGTVMEADVNLEPESDGA